MLETQSWLRFVPQKAYNIVWGYNIELNICYVISTIRKTWQIAVVELKMGEITADKSGKAPLRTWYKLNPETSRIFSWLEREERAFYTSPMA